MEYECRICGYKGDDFAVMDHYILGHALRACWDCYQRHEALLKCEQAIKTLRGE